MIASRPQRLGSGPGGPADFRGGGLAPAASAISSRPIVALHVLLQSAVRVSQGSLSSSIAETL